MRLFLRRLCAHLAAISAVHVDKWWTICRWWPGLACTRVDAERVFAIDDIWTVTIKTLGHGSM